MDPLVTLLGNVCQVTGALKVPCVVGLFRSGLIPRGAPWSFRCHVYSLRDQLLDVIEPEASPVVLSGDDDWGLEVAE